MFLPQNSPLPSPHKRLRYSGDEEDCHRPGISIWASFDDSPPVVTIKVDALYGQQLRFVDMGPDEARRLAQMLIEMADLIERAAKEPAAYVTESE